MTIHVTTCTSTGYDNDLFFLINIGRFNRTATKTFYQ